MSCVCAYSDFGFTYPVIDPLRVGSELPHAYAYAFVEDGMDITVAEDRTLTPCMMTVELRVAPGLRPKQLWAWNYCIQGPVLTMTAGGSITGTTSMLVRRGQCSSGTHTVVLIKGDAFNTMYKFRSDQLWAFWGGKRVTIDWHTDSRGSGQLPLEPRYPMTMFPDGTLVRSTASPAVVYVVFGGAKFRVDAANSLGFNLAAAQLMSPSLVNGLPFAPADGTLLREANDPRVYVVYGRAKFWIPDPPALASLGFTFANVRVVPPGGLANVPLIPRQGTLLREDGDPRVFWVTGAPPPLGAVRSWVTSPAVLAARCLSWSNVRLVPRGSLAVLPRGPDVV